MISSWSRDFRSLSDILASSGGMLRSIPKTAEKQWTTKMNDINTDNTMNEDYPHTAHTDVLMNRLQSVQNAAACLVTGVREPDSGEV